MLHLGSLHPSGPLCSRCMSPNLSLYPTCEAPSCWTSWRTRPSWSSCEPCWTWTSPWTWRRPRPETPSWPAPDDSSRRTIPSAQRTQETHERTSHERTWTPPISRHDETTIACRHGTPSVSCHDETPVACYDETTVTCWYGTPSVAWSQTKRLQSEQSTQRPWS